MYCVKLDLWFSWSQSFERVPGDIAALGRLVMRQAYRKVVVVSHLSRDTPELIMKREEKDIPMRLSLSDLCM
jgi:hypothetical protein